MKKIFIIASVLSMVLATLGCGDDYYDDYYDEYDYREDTKHSDDNDKMIVSSNVNADGSSTANTDNEDNDAYNAAVREPQVTLKGNGEDTVTILMYMNGSDLETEDGEATTDLKEMIKAGSSDKVNILVQTMGTKKWSTELGIASDRSQIYKLDGNGLTLEKDNLGQLNCTIAQTLKDFITYGATAYPADRYILLFWDHGGGPVYGYGYDQHQAEDEALTIDEIQAALRGAGVYFDFIGMDCCLMSSLEVCCALYDFCDYCVLAEDFESGLGWEYTTWLSKLYKNTSVSTEELGKSIIDSMIKANADENESGILALINQKYTKVLYSSWVDFAYSNEKSLMGKNFSRHMKRSANGRIAPILKNKGFIAQWLGGDSEDEYTLSDYFITDIMAVASNVDSAEADALKSAVSKAIVYVNYTSDDSNLTGISVTLPYGDSEFYADLQHVFAAAGFDSKYIEWLGGFVDASGNTDYYDYDEWDDEWDGWDDYDDDYDWSLWDWFFGDDYSDSDDYGDDYYDDYDWGWNNDDWGYEDSYNYWYEDNDCDGDYDDWYDDYYDDYYDDSWWDW
ncbi:MAG: clostripain-related cysteine peptidase [Lachnospiraceae bacterium]|nr:clostripain-related cysteine peptidase [Lachnospiraceae bacterium]